MEEAIKVLNNYYEQICAKIHESWQLEKKSQGFHPPLECPKIDKSDQETEYLKFTKHCDRCHTDMYPYDELPENVKEYDRQTLNAVISALEELQSHTTEG